ncbi:hypothetical protein [Acinetobacter towneri]|uniref:PilC beta-propeller domain-containing protein n=1 Tax=Acinetobacter towneri TaxID=202956 RepID=A0ABX7TEQ1_9GAMM|nr:hypothetical protein [Acinetobacter towneri]QTD59331.1 hypothetical protein J4G44_01325 [Acinetobacter towneri]QTD62100.1 hypothetical protein J4G45_02620 [Acinetobacter towneri]
MKNLNMKNVHRSALARTEVNMVIDRFKMVTLAASITTLICSSVTSYAADLEIYKIPENSTGTATLMLMLDTSGSMRWNMHNTSNASAGNSRLDILKKGLQDVLEGTATVKRVEDKVVMGLATFAGDNGFIRVPAKPLGEKTGEEVVDQIFKKPLWIRYSNRVGSGYGATTTTYYNKCTSWDESNYNCLTWSGDTTSSSGYKDSSPYKYTTNQDCNYGNRSDCRYVYQEIPKYRDETHRDVLLSEIKKLSPDGGTPTPYAYAEVAAYLMGQSTVLPNIERNVPAHAKRTANNTDEGWDCQSWRLSDNTCRNWGSRVTNYGNVPTGYTSSYSCTIRSGYTDYSATCYRYNKEFNDSDNNYSGWNNSVDSVKNATLSRYIAPSSITAQLGDSEEAVNKRECSGQGIYFLTDGEPEPNGTAPGSDGKSGTAYKLMAQSLGNKKDLFSCSDSNLGNLNGYKNPQNAWSCVGNYAETLLEKASNPIGLQIKTAVVGFSSSFSSDTNVDVQDAKNWGIIGGGKWYVGTNSQSVVDSINNFINEIQKDIPSMSTGSSTIPVDALNPEIIQPYAYSPQFEPKADPADNRQLWFGNLKKYYVFEGGIYSSPTGGSSNIVVKKSKLQDLDDAWAKAGVTYPDNTPVFKKGGVLSKLLLGVVDGVDASNQPVKKTGRKLLTEYNFDGTVATNDQITRNFDLNQIDHTYTKNAKTKTDEANRIRSLMALLGIRIEDSVDPTDLDLSQSTAYENLRQMGSIYHSLPVLLTQEGKAVAQRSTTTNKVFVSTTDRKDYVMFGTTQGLLTVVDADNGVEKFSFVPKEIIEKQPETFKENAGSLSGGKNALYYGLDGEWVAHTVYVTDSDGTMTVKGASRAILGATPAENENFDGKQWVYGGMRMGGRSYYSLDLTDINKPKLKFHIDPSTGKVYSADHPTGKTYAAISNMAQSWSKPKLDYVNWMGERKLVMFVGGGYDAGGEQGDGLYAHGIRTGYAGYEHYNYAQDNKKGSGVYMFDADNGDLLWYANSDSSGSNGVAHIGHNDLKYSVASDIKTIDRNNDGVVDHIYFGDLAGQAFRVDFNGTKTSFNSQINKILDLHQNDGTSPRFYMSPTFTAHHSAQRKEGAHVVVATFISGNKSSPLLATVDSPSETGKKNPLGLQYDAVYAIYDYDIHPNGQFFPNSHITARTLSNENATASTSHLKLIRDVVRSDNEDTLVKGALAHSTNGWGGWYYKFDKKFDGTDAEASIIKGLSPLIAMEGSLYVTMYDASNNGTSSSCGAGVKGHSFTQRLCLPTGVCPENANHKYNLGAGIVSLNVGSVDGSNIKSIVVPDPDDIGASSCVGTDCAGKPKFLPAGGSIRFIPNRWFERYAKMD